MISKSQHQTPDKTEVELELEVYPKPVCKYCWLWLLTEGLAIGILTGLVGVGGGFAIVPALVLLGKVPMKEAIGTSLLIICFNSIAGFAGYFGQVPLDYHLMVSFTFMAGLGIVLGAYLSNYIDAKMLQKGFAYFLMAIAAFILFQQRDTFRQRELKTQAFLPSAYQSFSPQNHHRY